MKIFFAPLRLVLPLMLTCGILDAYAMTLGRVSGVTLLGQTLDLSVAAQLAPEEELSQTCFEAEVFYGDIQQESSKVVVTASATVGARLQSVRIQSATKVDEPVVTVYLKSTCGQKTTRKYVMLADLPSEPTVGAVLPTNADLPAIGSIAKAELDSTKAPGRTVTLATTAATAKTNSNKRSRLKLDSLERVLDRDPVLKSTMELVTTPLNDLQKRVEALATWRALNAGAQDVLRDEARMRSLEGNMKSLTDASAKHRQSLEEISNRLADSESQRYANPFVYGLIAALLACLGGAAFLWTRRANFGERAPWWRGESAQESMYEPAASKPLVVERPGDLGKFDRAEDSAVAAKSSRAEKSATVQSVDIDLDLSEASPSAPTSQFPSFIPPSVEAKDSELSSYSRRDFGLSLSGALRYVNTKEMLDVRQQADFFMALGRHEEAIAVLESGIARTADANPLVYLDLLKLFHTLSRKSDFDLCRDKFNQLFTCLVPIYTNFHLSGNSLDAYPQVCAQIANLWPTSQAIEYIEFCLVRTPADAPEQGFDMEAYRDLLLLDSMAKQLGASNVTTIAPFSAAVGSYPTTDDSTGLGADRFCTASTVPSPVNLPEIQSTADNVDLDLSDLDGNLIDFDISHYEKSGIDTLGGGIAPVFQAGASDEPVGHQD
jgi:tetratricopeptide (TPR) repeat protein